MYGLKPEPFTKVSSQADSERFTAWPKSCPSYKAFPQRVKMNSLRNRIAYRDLSERPRAKDD
jgi:hypothetical protein